MLAGNKANPGHESYRCPVGGSRTALPSHAAGRWAGTAVARHAVGAVDSAHRRAMARTAVEVSTLSDLSSAFPTVAAFRIARRCAGPTGRGFARRGRIDLSETFIDARFSSAKKGALLSAQLAAAKAAKSWRSQTAMVFLSPAAWPALRRMKPNSSKPPSNDASPQRGRSG